MRHENFRDIRPQGPHPLRYAAHLCLVDTPTLPGKRSSGIASGDGNLRVRVIRLEILGNVPAILVKRTAEAGINIVKGNIVISRDYDLRLRQRTQEHPCLEELARP